MILYFTLAGQEHNLSRMPPCVCFVGQLQNLSIQVVKRRKTGHFSLLAVGVLSEMELSRCRDNHSSNIVQILFKVPRLTKTKSAKFVSDEQKGSHHHKLVFVYNCSFVQEHILAFKEAKIYISTNNALPHTGIMYIL